LRNGTNKRHILLWFCDRSRAVWKGSNAFVMKFGMDDGFEWKSSAVIGMSGRISDIEGLAQ
jgi:hypothetical protein